MNHLNPTAILYIDDDKENLIGFESAFSNAFKIITAESTKQAYRILKDEGSIGIVLVDYKMPKEDGISFVLRIKDEFPQKVFIIITAWVEINRIIGEIPVNPFYGFIEKPWNYNDVEAILSNASQLYQSKA
ncbi:MAG: response regulator [Bacteroidales bacterium]